jgi:hypothetical protein
VRPAVNQVDNPKVRKSLYRSQLLDTTLQCPCAVVQNCSKDNWTPSGRHAHVRATHLNILVADCNNQGRLTGIWQFLIKWRTVSQQTLKEQQVPADRTKTHTTVSRLQG